MHMAESGIDQQTRPMFAPAGQNILMVRTAVVGDFQGVDSARNGSDSRKQRMKKKTIAQRARTEANVAARSVQ
jgi:hypothetical protein